MEKVRTLFVALFIGVASLMVAAPATAATPDSGAIGASDPSLLAVSCSGSVTFRQAVNYAGSAIGELIIYYNSSNGGTNSACFYHRGASYNVAAPTYVKIFRCAERSGEGQACTPTASSSPDSGNFQKFAGPVGVTGTSNYCVAAYGDIQWRGALYYVSSGRQGCPNP